MDLFAILIAVPLMALIVDVHCGSQGFHFNRFTGPVSGPISRIELPHSHSRHGGPTFDYVAKPEYNFAYGVEDPVSGNYQNQKEERDGDVVRGEYSLVGADGVTRTVTYTADDEHGFQATVHMSQPDPHQASHQARYAQQKTAYPHHQHQSHEDASDEHYDDY